MRVAPLLLIAVGLIVVFQAGIWNLGMDGQFLLAAAVDRRDRTAPRAAHSEHAQPDPAVSHRGRHRGRWTIAPALLKARYGLNEIITTLMMTFIGINLASILVKGTFQDPTTTTPQTRAFDFAALLPSIPGTDRGGIHVGVLVALVAAVVVWFLMSRTSFGLRLQVLGASARAARHMGLDVPRLIVVSFLLSGMFVGFAAATEILGIWGYVRADWNPAFGLWVVPLVFLARLQRARASSRTSFLLSVASIGGDFAAQEADLTHEVHAAARRSDAALHGADRVDRATTRRARGSYSPRRHRAPPERAGDGVSRAARERCLLGRRLHGAHRGRHPRRRTAALRLARRARLRAGRRAQHRPRGDDADGRVRGLRRRLLRRQTTGYGFGAGPLAGAAVSLDHGALLRPLGPRPDRRRHRDHARLRGSHRAHLRRRVRREPPHARSGVDASRSRGSPTSRSSVAEESRTAASSASRWSSTSASCSSSSSPGCSAGRTWASTSRPQATGRLRSTPPA